jgi:hypothetical protein
MRPLVLGKRGGGKPEPAGEDGAASRVHGQDLTMNRPMTAIERTGVRSFPS